MSERFDEISKLVREFGSAPAFKEMPRRTLADKGIQGPTSAHVIEEIHTPLNLAYVTFTTGTTAFQNIVGVTFSELPERIRASKAALQHAGVRAGDKVLVTYPPLVNVFSGQALTEYGVKWSFLYRSSRDAFLAALYDEKPDVVVGESSFLRASLENAKHMGIAEELPKHMILLAAGTPMDLDLLPVAEEVLQANVHDLYGCQEFGWISIDGIPLRDDLKLVCPVEEKGQKFFELLVGGMPTGDAFPVSKSGHICNHEGQIITYRRARNFIASTIVVKATMLSAKETIHRVAKSILRIKGRVIIIDPQVETNAASTVLEITSGQMSSGRIQRITIQGPQQTKLFDDLVQAQIEYQQNGKADPIWTKQS